MDSTLIVALIGGLAALGGALIGAIPMYMTAKNQSESNRISVQQNNALILQRLEQIDKKLEKQENKNNEHDKHSEQIAKLDERIHSCEGHIERLYRYHQ